MNPRQTIDEIGHKEVLDNAVKVSNEDGHDTWRISLSHQKGGFKPFKADNGNEAKTFRSFQPASPSFAKKISSQ